MQERSIVEAKAAMRKDVIARRDDLDPAVRTRKSQAICENVFALLDKSRRGSDEAPLVALFSSFGSEVELEALRDKVAERGWRLCYPAMLREAAGEKPVMEFFEVSADLARSKAPAFMAHPARAFTREGVTAAGVHGVEVDEIDFAVIPLVAYDGHGGRLGYGGGNYDAFLGELRDGVPTVGVAFDEQCVPLVPRESHDLPLPIVVHF